MTNHRDAITGQYVTAEHAEASPDTTVSESPCTECERLRGIIHAQKVAIDGYREEVERLRAAEPIVRTVGDLTARHIRKRVRLGGGAEGHLSRLSLDEWGRLDLTLVSHHAGLRGMHEWININPDLPCEVLS